MKKLALLFLALIATAGVALPAAKAFAVVGSGQAHLSLSTSSSYVAGSTAYVTVSETSSVAVAGVEADFSYNAAQLQYLATDTSTSAFNTAQPSNGGSGSVTIARTEQSGTDPVGSATIAVVSFKVLGSSGTANLTILSSSDIDDSVSAASLCDSSCAGGNIGASFQMTAPAPVQSTGSNTGTGSTTSAGNNQSSTKGTTTPTSTANKIATTNGNANSASNSNGATSAASTAKGASTTHKSTAKVTKLSSPKMKHTALVTTSVSAIIVMLAAAYWLVFHKRAAETVPAVYKLDPKAKNKSRTKGSTATKSKRTTAKSPSVKASKTTSTSAKK